MTRSIFRILTMEALSKAAALSITTARCCLYPTTVTAHAITAGMATAHSITTAEVSAPLKSVKDTATIIKAVEVLSPLKAVEVTAPFMPIPVEVMATIKAVLKVTAPLKAVEVAAPIKTVEVTALASLLLRWFVAVSAGRTTGGPTVMG